MKWSGSNKALWVNSGCESTCVSLRVRAQKGQLQDQKSPGCLCLCISVCVMVCTSNGNRAVVAEVPMFRFQQPGRLESRGSYWVDWVSEPSCGGDLHCTYVCIFPLAGLCLGQRGEQDKDFNDVHFHVSVL